MQHNHPPLIQGFIDVQMRYPDFVILTEVGGFYEIWQLDDLKIGHAERASQILDIVLTRRDKSKTDSPKMAGFPSYAVNTYIKKLVAAGETVVVVKQEITGKKSDNNKNVKRFIERIVSPGTSIEEIKDTKPNFFACAYTLDDNVGIALIDLSTGYVSISEMGLADAKIYLETLNPLEVLFNSVPLIKKGPDQIFHLLDKPVTKQSSAGLILAKIYEIENPSNNHSVTLTQLGLELWPLASLSIANLLNFLTDYNPLLLKKLSPPRVSHLAESLFLSKNAFLSLDIFESPLQTDESKTLYGILNRCKTAMGRRALRRWIHQPLTEQMLIEKRLDAVERMILAKSFFENLSGVYDISRLTRRIALNHIEPHEMPGLYRSLKVSHEALPTWEGAAHITSLLNYLERNLDFENIDIQGAEYYRAFTGDLRSELDSLEKGWNEAKSKLDRETKRIEALLETTKLRILDRQESSALTGPKGLAVKAQNAGLSFKLKASEIQINDQAWESAAFEELGAKNALLGASKSLWIKLQEHIIAAYGRPLLDFSEAVGELDVLSTFASVSHGRGYCRPQFTDQKTTTAQISRMRHPVLELTKDSFEAFVPNDLSLEDKSILVIYGANSAGKSTILKGLALNIIMAQIGCFVAASSATLSIFQSIMTRMTTFDSLSEGLSTFTMEMIELQNALKKADERSLFLFDEIGRGTSVEDGEAIAFAIIEHLNSKPLNAVTLFATHYHSLYDSIKDFERVRIQHFECEIINDVLVISRELKSGPGNGSYGLAVARACGVPESIIKVGQNYKKKFSKLLVSRYNSKVKGTLCELCGESEAQETHHIQEQHQGKIKEIIIHGASASVHNEQNLVLLCGTCHRKITKEKLELVKRRTLGGDNFLVEVKKN